MARDDDWDDEFEDDRPRQLPGTGRRHDDDFPMKMIITIVPFAARQLGPKAELRYRSGA